MARKKPSAKQSRKRLEQFLKPFRVTRGKGFRLSQIDPEDSRGVKSKEEAAEYLQPRHRAPRGGAGQALRPGPVGCPARLPGDGRRGQGRRHQARHVRGQPAGLPGLRVQGARRREELDHDFLWRTSKALPERGRIGIFNRSYYEEVLVVKVHPEILEKQKLPRKLITKKIWQERYEDIRAFERYLARQGYLILKFFLHVSKKEQKERFLERLDRPEKNWKFSLADAKERGYWGAYQRAYEELIRETAAPHAPWYVVPADKKWFTRLVVAAAVDQSLAAARPRLPEGGRGQEEGAPAGPRGPRRQRREA